MPVWLRNTTFKFIEGSIKEENDANNKSNTGTTTNLDWSNPDKAKVNLPSYVTKASKK